MGDKLVDGLNVGDRAPDFALASWDGQTIGKHTLSAVLVDKIVVLAFYPLDFTGGCISELSRFQDDLAKFRRAGAEVLALSVDSVFCHQAFGEKYGYQFPLLSDFNRDAARAYDVLHEELMGLKGLARRSVFVIDQGGAIRYKWLSDKGSLPDNAAILQVIRELQGQ